MANVLAEVVLTHFDGIPADSVVNTFTFATPSVGLVPAELDPIFASLVAFYNVAPAGGNTIASRISAAISRTVSHHIKMYDLTGHLDGTAHGSPVFDDVFLLGAHAGAAADLPEEMAICASFRANYGTDVEFAPGARPRSSDRGRIFLGPLSSDVVTQDGATMRVRVKDLVRSDIRTNMQTLRDAAGHAWSVWSRKHAVTAPVTDVWVDDAFDVQRRRGEKAIVRTMG